MKDFQEQILDGELKQKYKLDPYVFVTPEMNMEARRMGALLSLKFISAYLLSNCIVAPLQTVVTSLQLSVKEHKNIYQTEEARTKQIARLNTQMTIHEKRKFQLMLKAGGKNTPYTAPVYGGYMETIKGIYSQGWRAFYKGLGLRTMHSLTHLLPLINLKLFLLDEDIEGGYYKNLLKLYGYTMILDLAMNPVYMMDNRYVLQNNLPDFRTFRKPFKAMRKAIHNGESQKGIAFHLFNNTVGLFTRLPVYISLITGQSLGLNSYLLFMTGEFITYPFLTAYRRLTCQTERHVGMIPTRYSGLIHACKVIAYEEGPKGLWRAFPLHLLQSFLKLEFIQIYRISTSLAY